MSHIRRRSSPDLHETLLCTGTKSSMANVLTVYTTYSLIIGSIMLSVQMYNLPDTQIVSSSLLSHACFELV